MSRFVGVSTLVCAALVFGGCKAAGNDAGTGGNASVGAKAQDEAGKKTTGSSRVEKKRAAETKKAVEPPKAEKAKGESGGVQMEDMVKTASGLRYKELKVGQGPTPQAGQKVEVHYTGWLLANGKKGRKFDSSLDRGSPFSFVLGRGQVIKGWDEGLSTMKVGGKRILVIPPELGYGARGAGGVIPPNATLMFEVELLGVK